MAYKDSPNKAYGVQYYNQFPKHFLKPYGEIRDPVDKETILKDVKPINCEYLCWPKIALSEMAETCSKNFERAIDTLRIWPLEEMKTKLEDYADKVRMLNTRTELPVTRDNVVDMMKFHATEDEQFLSLMDDLKVIGSAFYTTTIHYKVLRTLICNPANYAQKLQMANGADANFKKDPSVKNMKELLIKEVVTVKTPVKSARSEASQKRILQELDEDSAELSEESSSDDHSVIPPSGVNSSLLESPKSRLSKLAGKKVSREKSKRRKMAKAAKRALWEDIEDDSSHSEEPSTKRKNPLKMC